jgi:hypothetical protein
MLAVLVAGSLAGDAVSQLGSAHVASLESRIDSADVPNELRVLDARDDLERTAAALAGLAPNP